MPQQSQQGNRQSRTARRATTGWGSHYTQPPTQTGRAQTDTAQSEAAYSGDANSVAASFEDDHTYIPTILQEEWLKENPGSTVEDYHMHLFSLQSGTVPEDNQTLSAMSLEQTHAAYAPQGNTAQQTVAPGSVWHPYEVVYVHGAPVLIPLGRPPTIIYGNAGSQSAQGAWNGSNPSQPR